MPPTQGKPTLKKRCKDFIPDATYLGWTSPLLTNKQDQRHSNLSGMNHHIRPMNKTKDTQACSVLILSCRLFLNDATTKMLWFFILHGMSLCSSSIFRCKSTWANLSGHILNCTTPIILSLFNHIHRGSYPVFHPLLLRNSWACSLQTPSLLIQFSYDQNNEGGITKSTWEAEASRVRSGVLRDHLYHYLPLSSATPSPGRQISV